MPFFMDGSQGRRPSLDDQPTDILVKVVSILANQPSRPENVVALCQCNRQLLALLPHNLQRRWLENALQARPSSSDVRAMGLLHTPFDNRTKDLQMALVSNAVKKKLKLRPQPAFLVEHGVLKAPPCDSPWLIETRERLNRLLIKKVIQRNVAEHMGIPCN